MFEALKFIEDEQDDVLPAIEEGRLSVNDGRDQLHDLSVALDALGQYLAGKQRRLLMRISQQHERVKSMIDALHGR